MTAGLTATLANSALGTVTASAGFAQLHIGDPGAAGTANIASVATRQSVTWAAASGGTIAISNVPSWGNWSGTSPQTLTHLSLWSLVTGGVFQFSLQLPGNGIVVVTGSPLSLTSLSVPLAPLAA
jgi:hypothetical protein